MRLCFFVVFGLIRKKTKTFTLPIPFIAGVYEAKEIFRRGTLLLPGNIMTQPMAPQFGVAYPDLLEWPLLGSNWVRMVLRSY